MNMENRQYIYVSPAGNDNNDGSREKPFATINRAAEVAEPGTTVCVAPGLYRETVRIHVSGTENGRIRFVSEIKWGAEIIDENCQDPVKIYGDYIDFEGFEITGNATHGICVAGSHVTISGNHVYGFAPYDWQATNSGGAGIVTYDGEGYKLHDIHIIGNLVHDIGPRIYCNFIHGIYTAGNQMYVKNNIVYNTTGYGIHAWHAANNNVFANNLVFANRRGGIVLGAGDSPGGVIADNFIVTNNIIIYNIGIGISELGLTGLNNRYENNLIYGNTEAPVALQNGLRDRNTLNVDPQFVCYKQDGSGNYRLKPTSPCIDAGTELGAPSIDFDGNARPQGKAVDIGPFEYVVKT